MSRDALLKLALVDDWGSGRPGGLNPAETSQSLTVVNCGNGNVEKNGENRTPANRAAHSCARDRPIGAYAAAFLDRIEQNAAREVSDRHLISAALNCGADAARFLEIIHAHLSAGHPIPNSYRLMTEAREWASWASTAENKAYALACYEAMPPADQAAFLRHVSGQVVA